MNYYEFGKGTLENKIEMDNTKNTKKQVTHSNTNPAVCSTLRMRTAISPWQWQPWTAVFVLVRTHQHGIAVGPLHDPKVVL